MKTTFKTILCALILSAVFAGSAHAAAVGKQVSGSGLVGWWRLDEGTSTVAHDFSGSGYTGTLNSFAAPATSVSGWNIGKLGKALTFDGSNDYVNTTITTAQLNITQVHSYSFWIKTTAKATASVPLYFGNYTAFSPNFNWDGIALSADGATISYVQYDGTEAKADATITPGRWTYIVAVHDGTNLNIYKDGVFQSQIAKRSPSVNSSATLRLGATQSLNASDFYAGSLDDVRIYSRILSATEIYNLYRSGEVTYKTVSDNGLVAQWTFDEGTSTKAHDFSGNGNTGTWTGTPSWTVGKRGYAGSFDGSTQFISAGNSSTMNVSTAMTLSAWVKPSGSGHRVFMARGRTGGQWDGYEFAIDLNNAARVTAEDAGATVTTFNLTAGSVPNGIWSHVVFTFSGGTGNMYVNGVFVGTASGTFTSNTYTNYIGQRGGGSRFSGLIDDVRIYNRALSAAEVASLYKENSTRVGASQETAGNSSGLVGYWSFNGKDIDWTALKAWDRSGNNNHGTLTNMSQTTTPAAGRAGQALYFDGSNDYVTINQPLTSSSPFTISMWYYPTRINAAYDILYSGNDNIDLQMFFDAVSKQLTTSIENVEIGVAGLTLTSSTINKWYHIVWTYDYSRRKVYVNGVLQANNADTTALTINDTTVRFGNLLNSLSYPLQGKMDEVRIYNRAISAGEVKLLYQNGR